MTIKKDFSLSCRIDEETNEILKTIMQDNKLCKSEAVRYMAKKVKDSNSNNNPYYRNLIAWLTMNMESALNEIKETGNVEAGRKVLEEFKCQIL